MLYIYKYVEIGPNCLLFKMCLLSLSVDHLAWPDCLVPFEASKLGSDFSVSH